jgi:hypothetical protein
MAAFHLIIYGRFCVITEGLSPDSWFCRYLDLVPGGPDDRTRPASQISPLGPRSCILPAGNNLLFPGQQSHYQNARRGHVYIDAEVIPVLDKVSPKVPEGAGAGYSAIASLGGHYGVLPGVI